MGMRRKLLILIIDHEPEFLKLLRNVLQNAENIPDVRILEESTYDGGLKALEKLHPDLVILEVFLSGGSGLDLCHHVRELDIQHNSYTGVIFVTSDERPDMISRCLSLGGDDFCAKYQVEASLVARVRAVLRIKRMADTLRTANEKLRASNKRLEKMTITDDLTKLNNMRYFVKRLNQEFIRARRYSKALSIIMLDLDRFKEVNDKCDHLFGSFVIAEVGKLISRSVRSVDIAARFGGDEFIIMLPETNSKGAYILAERIRQRITDYTFDNQQYQVKVNASLGVITYDDGSRDHILTAYDLMRTADLLLYEAKHRGRNRVAELPETGRDSYLRKLLT